MNRRCAATRPVPLPSLLALLALLALLPLAASLLAGSRRAILPRALRSLSDTALHSPRSATSFDSEFRPSITDKARTVTYVCTSATLCTSSVMGGVEGMPFGSYVDYIMDDKGWPILLLNKNSLHTQNIKQNSAVSLFCQLPRSRQTQTTAALSRVTTMGHVQPIPDDELVAIKLAFSIVHPYAEQIVDSPLFSFFRIKPVKIYFSGGFGVQATWVDVEAYEQARPDALAQEVPAVLSRVNLGKQPELRLMCKHFLGLPDVEAVRLQAIDQLGVDLRVKQGDFTDEFRVGFRQAARSAEDAKSELMKLFQEAWERDHGPALLARSPPPVTKYAEDIMRQDRFGPSQRSATR